MNPKNIILLFYILINPIFSFSQGYNAKASYNIRLAEDNLFFEAELYINSSSSLFRYKNFIENRWERWENDNQAQVVYTDSIGEIFKYSYNKAYFEIRTFCMKEPILFNDYFRLNWTLGKGIKEIGGIKCQMASVSFRGRDYTAWYAPSIPLKTGPWKFHGLPGLILEVYDKEMDIEITLNNYESNKFVGYSYEFIDSKKVSVKEYIKCKEKEWEHQVNKDMANLAKLRAKFPDLELDVTHDRNDLTERIYE